MTSTPYLSVQALTKYIKKKFDADPHMRDVYVKGELSNVKRHTGSGHIYFTLKDEKTQIAAVMFAKSANRLKFEPENGMKVFIRGDVNVYEGSGRYQLYAASMEPDGVGSLHIAFEQLQAKLYKEGLFDEQHKKAIPTFPRKIGVVTAPTGAAIRDICTTITQHYALADVVIFPALVQGEQAAPSIVKAIKQANSVEGLDVLIVGRGGGSIEDLWAFNEEIVARAIYESVIPIISGVGHETDTTIADHVSDWRAATPTAAAKKAVPNSEDLMKYILTRQSQLFQLTQSRIRHERSQLERLQKSYPLTYPDRLYRPFVEKLSRTDEQIQAQMTNFIKNKQLVVQRLTNRVQMNTPLQEVRYNQQHVARLKAQLDKSVVQNVNKQQDAFRSIIRTLEALNPLTIMNRGYSIVYQDGKVVKSVQQVKEKQNLTIHFPDGQANAEITSITMTKRGEE
ncbi:exodeoxyribonuclease VII large subunit [Viridibacillus sp. YIM B01967]|uniref:Exodeoxyribonuclease 7 large subunit n=1 Tax=Viridibacillus soli TaxID=2798301 RepID=A0ABS1H4G4_9BACL|nr:exodeoxyribonuclease VII large subunit [Viridibacillus soli]MBK3494037.1 exodeoxyribonuclease VII large subunit [Viridibacillus soli]